MKVTASETCAECFFENSFLVDLEKEGYQAKCADCGADLMLCDACQHLPDGTYVDICDFRWIDQERGIGTCFRREAKDGEAVNMTCERILDLIGKTDQDCESCRFNFGEDGVSPCDNDQPCVYGEIVLCLAALSQAEEKRPLVEGGAFGKCPACGAEMNSELISEYNIKHCPYCGQRIDTARMAPRECACPYFALDTEAQREAEELDAARAAPRSAEERAATEAWARTRPVGELDPTAHCGPHCKHLKEHLGGPNKYVYRCAAPSNEHVIHVDRCG